MYFKNDKLISLERFADFFEEVVRDCEFFCAGKVGNDIDGRVVYVESEKYLKQIESLPGIVGVIVPHEMKNSVPPHLGCAVASSPVRAFWEFHQALVAIDGQYWTDFDSMVSPSAVIHPSAVIAPKNVVIGERTQIGANTVVDERSIIGDDVFIGTLSHIGAPAYELFDRDGRNTLPTQAGGVKIDDNAIVLSCTTVVRSCFPSFTEIGENASVDNLVHVAHDCKIGKGSKVVATTILCGRVVLGENAYVGPNATVSNGISVGDGGRVSLGAVVTRNVEPGQTVSGNFARDHREFLKSLKSP